MGYGDELMATGMAKGALSRGKRIAFGDGSRIIWGPWAHDIFRGNPNIARPGEERSSGLEWIAHHKGHRLYNRLGNGRWIWNMSFLAQPGEIFFDDAELAFTEDIGRDFILIEPNVPRQKSVAPNKDWGRARYQQVADRLRKEGRRVIQFAFGRDVLDGVDAIKIPNFRHALAVLSKAALYIGPEGGLHHGAAAVGIPAVVLFGGFIPPQVTGYAGHTNLTGGMEACGSLKPCEHCRSAMDAIGVDEVHGAARNYLLALAA